MFLPVLTLLLLASCRSTNPWSVDRVTSGNTKFNSTKLTHFTNDPIHGLDLEFLKTHDRLYVYLNVHSTPIPPLKTDPESSFVYISVESEKHRFEAHRREGGQRLLLPDSAVELIISSLEQQHPITIHVAGYQSLIAPSEFSKQYQKIKQSPLFENPFHLPF